MCKAWHSYLDPHKWPIKVRFDGRFDQHTANLADWVFYVEPAVQEMSIYLEYDEDPTLENPLVRSYWKALLSLRPRAVRLLPA